MPPIRDVSAAGETTGRRTRALGAHLARRGPAGVADARAAVAIELAILLPALLLVSFLILQCGFTLVTSNNLYDAARQAARRLATGTVNEAEATAAADALLADWPTRWDIVGESAATTGTADVRVRIGVAAAEAGVLGLTPVASELSADVVRREE